MTLEQRNLLIENYIPFAKKIAYKYAEINSVYFWYEEIKSAAFYGLVLAAEKYDNSKSNFANFAKIKIIGAIKDFVRSEFKKRSTEIGDFDPGYQNSNLTEFLEFFIFNLECFEKEIFFDYYLNNRTMSEIAQDRALSKSRISQILFGIKNKLRCNV